MAFYFLYINKFILSIQNGIIYDFYFNYIELNSIAFFINMNRDSVQKDFNKCEEIINISENILCSDFKDKTLTTELSLLLNELKGDLQDQISRFRKDIYEIGNI
jgi:hypothetical protein